VRGGVQAAAARHVEVLAAHAFDLRDVIDDACFAVRGGFQQDGSGAVAKDDADGAIGEVGHGGVDVGADHQEPFCIARIR